jgi:bacterioferritin-associated ferredoxin
MAEEYQRSRPSTGVELIFIISSLRLAIVIVCCCHRVTDREIRRAASAGARTMRQIAESCGAGASCGGCRTSVCEILDEVHDDRTALSGNAAGACTESVSA